MELDKPVLTRLLGTTSGSGASSLAPVTLWCNPPLGKMLHSKQQTSTIKTNLDNCWANFMLSWGELTFLCLNWLPQDSSEIQKAVKRIVKLQFIKEAPQFTGIAKYFINSLLTKNFDRVHPPNIQRCLQQAQEKNQGSWCCDVVFINLNSS